MYTFKLKQLGTSVDGAHRDRSEWIWSKRHGWPVHVKLIPCMLLGCMVLWLFYASFGGVLNFATASHYTAVNSIETGKDALEMHLRRSQISYAVIFDAGSTGTRVHVYRFKMETDGPHLEEEVFQQVTPGLSSYSDVPENAAASLRPLLSVCEKAIPPSRYADTPVILRATAGLRLLPPDAADHILDEVKKVLDASPFRVEREAVAIMGGVDEGLFSWITVNFLMDALQGKTYGALDLGGGSTQITFVPAEEKTLAKLGQKQLREVNVLHRKHLIYTHSYLGFGLMSGRFQMLGQVEDPHRTTAPSLPGTESPLSNVLHTHCFSPHLEATWTHYGTDYIVRGFNDSRRAGFDACLTFAAQLHRGKMAHIEETSTQKFFAFSYYFDRAMDAGITTADGGELQVNKYADAARKVCKEMHPSTPFLCMDLVYTYSLLHHGFGLQDSFHIRVAKKIDGKETSWALGAAFHIL